MPRNVSKNPIKQKREKKRLAKLEKAGRLVKGVEIPEGACREIQTSKLGRKDTPRSFTTWILNTSARVAA